MITLQQYSSAQLHAETIKSADIQMTFNVGEVYANCWVNFIQRFDIQKYDISNNGIVRKLTLILNNHDIVTIEIHSDFLSSCKNLTISFRNKSFSVNYKNFESFNNALTELSKYYEQNNNTFQGLESK